MAVTVGQARVSSARHSNRHVTTVMERWRLRQTALGVSCGYEVIALAMAVLNTAHTSEDEHSSDTEKSGFVDDDDDIGSAWDLIQENDLDPDPEWNQTTG